eukprot:14114530-Alexandrium_andersonii.AAC.1
MGCQDEKDALSRYVKRKRIRRTCARFSKTKDEDEPPNVFCGFKPANTPKLKRTAILTAAYRNTTQADRPTLVRQ